MTSERASKQHRYHLQRRQRETQNNSHMYDIYKVKCELDYLRSTQEINQFRNGLRSIIYVLRSQVRLFKLYFGVARGWLLSTSNRVQLHSELKIEPTKTFFESAAQLMCTKRMHEPNLIHGYFFKF